MLNWLIGPVVYAIGPALVRLISSQVGKMLVRKVVQDTFDQIEAELNTRGFKTAADALEEIEKAVLAKDTQLVAGAQQALMLAPSVAQRARG